MKIKERGKNRGHRLAHPKSAPGASLQQWLCRALPLGGKIGQNAHRQAEQNRLAMVCG